MEWKEKHPNSEYVWNKKQFDEIDVDKVDHVIGTLFDCLKRVVVVPSRLW